MRHTAFLAAIAVAAALGLSACSNTADTATTATTSAESPMSQSSTVMVMETGTFGGLNDKSVTGTATITGTEVQLTGFSSDEGPDLHLYLTNGTDETAVASGIELGTIAFDEPEQTFPIGGTIDVSGYTHLVVHCDKAKAVFGAAALT